MGNEFQIYLKFGKKSLPWKKMQNCEWFEREVKIF